MPKPTLATRALVAEHLDAMVVDAIDDAETLRLHADIARGLEGTQTTLTRSEAAWLGRRLRDETPTTWVTHDVPEIALAKVAPTTTCRTCWYERELGQPCGMPCV